MELQERLEKLAMYFAQELNEEDRAEMDRWKDSPEGQAEFDRYRLIWENSSKQLPTISKSQKDEAYQDTWELIRKDQKHQPTIKKSKEASSGFRFLKIAASLLLFSLIGIGAFWMYSQQSSLIAIAHPITASAPKTVTLADGSIVHMKQGSTIKYADPFDAKQRLLQLEGEAYFEIAKDSNRPFVVETSESKIQVLGTKFNIKETAKRTKVNVTEGKVRFSTANNDANTPQTHLILTANESGTLMHKTAELSEASFEHPNFLAWKTGTLQFENVPIEEVVTELSDLYQVGFRFSTVGIADCPFTGVFKGQNLRQILKSIEQSFGWKIHSRELRRYLISGKSCS